MEMKYCVECGSEYRPEIKECADCPPGSALVDAATMHRLGIPLPGEQDTRRFVRIATAEDPLTAESYLRILEDEKIPVLARPRRAGAVDLLTTGTVHPWWEILVTEPLAARASALLFQARAGLESTQAEAVQAAEEEALAPPEPPGSASGS